MFKRILACLMVLLTLVSYLPPRASAEETQPQEETTEVSATQPSEPATVPTEPTAAAEETTAPTQPETAPTEETSFDETLPEEALVDTYALPEDGDTVASGQCGDNLTWSVDAEGTLTISGTGAIPDFECVMGETPNYPYCGVNTPWHSYLIRKVIVEEGIVAVGSYALAYLEKMESISLPASLRKLGTQALANDVGLKQVVLPENLETLGEMALFQCSGLSSVRIPAGVKNIGSGALDGCRLDSITVDGKSTAFCAEDGVLYTKDKKELRAITSNRTELTIPDSVTSVDSVLYSDGYNLKTITIGAQCNTEQFSGLSSCSNLLQISVADNNPYLCVKDNVLFSKDGTVLVSYASARPGISYTVPTGTKKINFQAFHACRSLYSIVLPDGLTEIDYDGIGCANLKEITIPASVTTINSGAVGFHYGVKLENLIIRGAAGSVAESYAKENGFTFVEIGATSGECGDNLTWSVDAEGVLTISGTGAMWDYTDIVENGMIHTTAPWYAYSPVKLILEEGISHIGDNAFEGCSSITGSLTLPESLTSIGPLCFLRQRFYRRPDPSRRFEKHRRWCLYGLEQPDKRNDSPERDEH